MRSMRRLPLRGTALAAGLALALSACGGGGDGDGGGETGTSLKGVKLEVAAVWTGGEAENFKKVLAGFTKKTGATVTLTPTGDNVAAFLGSKIQGGGPPDVAMLPQQGVLVEFAEKGWIKPLGDDVKQTMQNNYAQIWQDLGSVDGKLYGVYFKAANKSLMWYRPKAFEDAGVQPPASWADLVKTAGTLSDSGATPLAVAGGDGWTLTDWFENVYASHAGGEKYDRLAKHEIKWTDPTVKESLRKLAELWRPGYLAGGADGALQMLMPQSVTAVFGADPKAAMVYEGDFVAGVIGDETQAKVGTDAKFFPFPAVGAKPPVVGGGDAAVVLKESKGAQELMKYLASAEAATIWAKLGGFTSPNKSVDLSAYPDDVQRQIAKSVIDAGNDFRFDMSDLAPAAFGGTKGSGEWKRLQDFLKDPSKVDEIAAALEADAAKAFKN